ncbi:hypothetical protein HK102_013043 [Quaeritorhiza haematococci]|nr:hypothetical protein HK102_013043 [Quaeritorhiza haematococci]
MVEKAAILSTENFDDYNLHVLLKEADKDLQEHMKKGGRLPKPQSHAEAISRPDAELWRMTEEEKCGRLKDLDTFELVDRPKDAPVVGSRDVYDLKETPTCT